LLKLAKTVLARIILSPKLNQISSQTKLLLRKKMYYNTYKQTTNTKKVYWISTHRICAATIRQNGKKQLATLSRKMRGKIVNGDWDKTAIDFTKLEAYRRIKRTIEEDEELHNADFFKRLLVEAKSPSNFWSNINTYNLQKLLKYFNSKDITLGVETASTNSKQHKHLGKSYYDAIDVNIGRNGEYLLQDNLYLLSLAKLLKVESVPVRIFIRHKKWQQLRNFVINYLQNPIEKGLLYQPIVHPDFEGVPVQRNNLCQETMDVIQSNLTKESGTMLDIGANVGFFCHKFEDLGYQCYAVEMDPNNYRILEGLRDAEKKKFVTINKSVFDIDFLKTMHFDVVLALNIFHHFTKTKSLFCSFQEFLHNLRTDLLFLSTAHPTSQQMENAYRKYSEPQFAKFVLQHTDLNKCKQIFTGRYGRSLYKLSK
jgi:2-polyprenyl-3-methyl-5-hydroxy-6-metoxy-1,4-benzoquinol methylase